jgi:hypothetical protein
MDEELIEQSMVAPEVEAEAEEPATPQEVEPPVVESDAALVQKMQQMVEVPQFLTRWYAQFAADRKYVNQDCMLLDTEQAVATNYILRNQIVLMANLYAREPAISWKPAPIIGEHPPLLGQYGKTLEIFCKKQAEEIELKRLLRGGIQDASTIGWAVFKLNPQEDPKLDPLGNRRQNDQLDNLARYQWLKRRAAHDQISEDSATAQEIKDLEQVVAKYLQDQVEADLINNQPQMMPMMAPNPMTGMMEPQMNPITGEPLTQMDMSDPRIARLEALKQGQIPPDMDVGEISRFIGFNLDPIQGEDFRFDWTVASTENLYAGEGMGHRVFMDYDKFGSSFEVSPAEIGQIILFGDDGGRMSADTKWSAAALPSGGRYDGEAPADRDNLEAPTNMGRCAVWEWWDKRQGMVYTWVEGMKRFLRKNAPTIVGRRWFPFYFLPFNRVTGRPLPISDTLLTRQLQDELNRRRTQEAEAQDASFPRIFIKRGSVTKDEKNDIETSHAYQVIELDSPDDVSKAFAETRPLPFNPDLYNRNDVRMEMEMMSGISRNAAGSGQGELATTAAIANEQMGVQVDFRRALLDELIYDILYDIAYMANQFFPEENWKAICGQGAYVPLLERETFLRQLKLEVRAGSTGRPDAEKNLKVYEMLAGMAPQLGLPLDGEALLEDIMYEMGKPDWKKYLMTPEKAMQKAMMGMPVPGMMGPGAGAPPGPGQPRGNAAQPNPTPGEGAPTMAERGPPKPGSVPGPV